MCSRRTLLGGGSGRTIGAGGGGGGDGFVAAIGGADAGRFKDSGVFTISTFGIDGGEETDAKT